MKAILEFNLPEEAKEHNFALRASVFANVIFEYYGWLRRQYKYEEGIIPPEVAKKCIEELDLILEKNGLTFDDLL